MRAISRSARTLTGLAAAAFALAAARPALAQGCAMCGGALTEGPLGQAFNTSILFMIAAPYAIVGAVGGWIVYRHRAAARPRAAVIDLTAAGSRPPQAPAAEPTRGDAP